MNLSNKRINTPSPLRPKLNQKKKKKKEKEEEERKEEEVLYSLDERLPH
jgi:hypothetical protein